ncbi:hypothetical protein SUDANB145_02746 [Streptomyces sp. enrichment culture]|uniref:NAD(P)H-dependent oxidoreductase n=1 Tax=Streptomyces sp. enrichment culture TaxID=1795815 RepID=UPI003F57A179
MSDLKIAVVVGSTRPGRKGRAVAEWVLARAGGRPGARYELVDLLDFPLPLLDEPMSAKATGADGYTHDHTRAWAAKVAEYDGFVFVTPEYNHSLSGTLKNALDFLYEEWNNKAAAVVSYGAAGGVRAAEHLRGILSELQVAHVQQQLGFSAFTDFVDYRTPEAALAPTDIQRAFADTMFAQLETWAGALRSVRAAAATAAGPQDTERGDKRAEDTRRATPWAVMATFDVKEGCEEEWSRLVQDVIDEMRHEKTFISTSMCRRPDEPGKFLLFEVWADRAEFFATQVNREYRRPLMERLPELTRSPVVFDEWTEIRADHAVHVRR